MLGKCSDRTPTVFAESVDTYWCGIKAFSMTGAGEPRCPSDDEHGGSFPDGCGWEPVLATGRVVWASIAEADLEHILGMGFVLGPATQVSVGELQFAISRRSTCPASTSVERRVRFVGGVIENRAESSNRSCTPLCPRLLTDAFAPVPCRPAAVV